MAHVLAVESQVVAEDLYRLIQVLDPANWSAQLEQVARARIQALRDRLGRLCAQRADQPKLRSLQESLFNVARILEDRATQRDWRATFERLQPAYEAVARRLHEVRIEVPELRQTNYSRSLVHVGFGFLALFLLHTLTPTQIRWAISGVLLFAVVAETSRRFSQSANAALMKVFAPIAHPHEHHQINSASWYTLALAIIVFTTSQLACSLAVMVLGLADPAAALIGRRFGRTPLRHGRSLEGTLVFVAVGTVASLGVMAFLFPGLGTLPALGIGLVAGVAGALAELFSGRRLDDNFTIPVAVAAAVALVQLFFVA